MKTLLTLSCLMLPLIERTTAQSLNDIPSCATTAALSSIASTGCNIQDYACICSDSSFINSLLTVVEKDCSPADLQKTLAFAQQFCASVSVPISVTGITFMPTSSSASAGAATTSAVTTNTVSPTSTSTLSSSASSTSPSNSPAQMANAASPFAYTAFQGLPLLARVLGLMVGRV